MIEKKFTDENLLKVFQEGEMLSIAEVARRMQCSRNTAKPMLERAVLLGTVERVEIIGLGFGYKLP